jgi:hypothetical protein
MGRGTCFTHKGSQLRSSLPFGGVVPEEVDNLKAEAACYAANVTGYPELGDRQLTWKDLADAYLQGYVAANALIERAYVAGYSAAGNLKPLHGSLDDWKREVGLL